MKKGYFLVFLTALISGFAIFINRFGVKVIDPYIFTFLKNFSAAILLTAFIFSFKDWQILKRLGRKQWLFLILIGLIGGAVPFLLFFKGLSLSAAAKGAFIHKTMFIYIAFLAFLFLKEKIDKKFLLGGVLLILGSLFLLRKIPYSINFGDLLIFLATLFWAAENVISKYVLKELSGRIVAWARMFFGSLFILLFLLLSGRFFSLSGFSFSQLSWILITAIILFGYVMTWYGGLKHIPVSQASVILLLGSPITTFLSLVWSGKVVLWDILGALLIISGVIFAFGLVKTYQAIKETIYVRVRN